MVKPCPSFLALYLNTPECTWVSFSIGDLHEMLHASDFGLCLFVSKLSFIEFLKSV
jgi:hypothetical protein